MYQKLKFKQEALDILSQHLSNMQIFYFKLMKYEDLEKRFPKSQQSRVLGEIGNLVDEEIKIIRSRMKAMGIVDDKGMERYMKHTDLRLIPMEQHQPKLLSTYLDDDLNQLMKTISIFPDWVLEDRNHMDNTYKIIGNIKEAIQFFANYTQGGRRAHERRLEMRS